VAAHGDAQCVAHSISILRIGHGRLLRDAASYLETTLAGASNKNFASLSIFSLLCFWIQIFKSWREDARVPESGRVSYLHPPHDFPVSRITSDFSAEPTGAGKISAGALVHLSGMFSYLRTLHQKNQYYPATVWGEDERCPVAKEGKCWCNHADRSFDLMF
jgi:hypothetical protein